MRLRSGPSVQLLPAGIEGEKNPVERLVSKLGLGFEEGVHCAGASLAPSLPCRGLLDKLCRRSTVSEKVAHGRVTRRLFPFRSRQAASLGLNFAFGGFWEVFAAFSAVSVTSGEDEEIFSFHVSYRNCYVKFLGEKLVCVCGGY